MILKAHFLQLAGRLGAGAASAEAAWEEIARAYGGRGRHYHTLAHLEHMLTALEPVAARLADSDAVYMALYYHDLVYRVPGSRNEEESAAAAKRQLEEWNVPGAFREKVGRMILATKQHVASGDGDTDHFTDADLSVLGAEPERYARYASDVRREYRIYPDLLYKPGRRKVLQHFLAMPRIFKTAFFQERCEVAARRNLQAELGTLS